MRSSFNHQKIASLVARIKNGEEQLWGELLAEARVEQLVRSSLLSLRYHETALDIAQDAVVQAWRCLPQLRDNTTFVSWFKMIVRSIVRAHWKAETARGAITTVADVPEEAHVHGATLTSVDDTLNVTFLRAQIDVACKPNHAKVLHLGADGHSDPEIAVILVRPLGTVKTWGNRGREELRVHLATLGYDVPAAKTRGGGGLETA